MNSFVTPPFLPFSRFRELPNNNLPRTDVSVGHSAHFAGKLLFGRFLQRLFFLYKTKSSGKSRNFITPLGV
jgi:hypothetical protein